MAEKTEAKGLQYIGRGVFLPGVPARDLSAAEVAEHGGVTKLLNSGLYRPVKDGK